MTEVTALVSAYYAEAFLEKRLRNLMELLPPPKIMIVCQHSSREHEIAHQFMKSRPSLFEIYPTADVPTLYKAWNMGIAWTKGEYLTSANCDDFTYPQGLNVMRRYLDAHPEIDLVYGDCDMRIRDVVGIVPWKRGVSDLEHGINRVGVMPMWRRSLHDRFGMFDDSLTVSGDYEFWRRCEMGGAKLAHLDITVGLYWKRDESLENRNKTTMRNENARIINA